MQVFGSHNFELPWHNGGNLMFDHFDSPGLRFFYDADRVIQIQAPGTLESFNNSPKISIVGI